MNSKNYTAAEKHFMKKQEQYERRIKSLNQTISEQNTLITEFTTNNQNLQNENAQLKIWIKCLLKYTDLSEEDIKAVCEKDKKIGDFLDAFNILTKLY